MSNIDHMLASIINKDKEGFSDAFSDEMKERLATSIIDKNLNISQDLLSDGEEIDSEEQEEIEESGVVKKEKPIPMDLLYPKGHPRAGEIVGGKKKTKPEESEKMKRYKAKWNPKNMKRDAVRTGMEKTESVEPLDEKIDRTELKNKLGAEVARVTHGDKKHTHKTNKQAKLLRKLERKEKESSGMPGILPYTPDQWAQHKRNMENLKDHVEPLEELRGAKFFPSGYTFKTTKDAKEFAVALKHMGVKKNNISIKGKTISVNLVGGRHHDTLIMIKNLAKDMKASINEGNVIGAIREAHLSENGVIYTLKDAENIHILPEDAESIIQIHDKLNGDNQTVLRDMLSETEESYYKVLNFCNKKHSKE
jgi:hypothetical protein